MRTIEYLFDADQLQAVRDVSGRVKLDEALGYLTSWGLNAYDAVRLSTSIGPMGCEIAAAFYGKASILAQRPAYLLMAVWDPRAQAFGFHS